MRALFAWRGTSYFHAFLLQSIVATITVLVALGMHGFTRTRMPGPWHLGVTALSAMLSTFGTLWVMHLSFGYGGGMLDETTSRQRRARGSVVD